MIKLINYLVVYGKIMRLYFCGDVPHQLNECFLVLPFGLSLPVILPAFFKKKVLFTVLVAAGISISVELIQFVFELGRVETDDVIHNTLGAALGALPVFVNRMRVKN